MIAIFAGHVGKDSGAVNKENGLYSIEAVINGQIAVRLETLLSISGFPCKQYYGPFSDKVEAANKECDIGISLHCDSLPQNTSARGMHTIIYPNSLEAKNLSRTIIYFWSKSDIIIPILKEQPEERNDLYILKNTKFPTVLIEMGFLTNRNDEKLLYDMDQQKKIAEVICTSLKYRDNKLYT